MTGQEWDALRQAELQGIDPKGLVPLDTIQIDTGLPVEERLQRFLAQVKNPYCFLCGDTPVKLRFAADGEPLETILRRYFSDLKQEGPNDFESVDR